MSCVVLTRLRLLIRAIVFIAANQPANEKGLSTKYLSDEYGYKNAHDNQVPVGIGKEQKDYVEGLFDLCRLVRICVFLMVLTARVVT